ncbi:hypothetical protein N7475_003582 [Penicillium sp. IBT 31633x]|nr:hypothetical protein N7475_003582 [Penicillium sp. IBT 31633x]
MHIQRPGCRKQHKVYIMSCNIASVLGYGTAVYPHMADLFSMKQSSGTANGSASAKKSSTGLSLQLKLNQAFPAIRLTFRTLSVLFRYSNYPNAVPGIHFSLAFLWGVSFHYSIMESLEATAPWKAVTGFLNSLLSHNTVFSKIEDEKFPTGDDITAPQLPEDFLIRGQVWSQFYYPDNFFHDASGYGSSIDEEGSEKEVRRYRCLWLGVQIATVNRHDLGHGSFEDDGRGADLSYSLVAG